MFVVANFLLAIATVLDLALSVYMWMIIIRAVISWITPFSSSPFLYTLRHGLARVTDPVLWRIQKLFRLGGMGIDISPMIAILAILFIKYFVVATLLDIAQGIKGV